MNRPGALKDYLEQIVAKYNKRAYIQTDPISAVHEIAGKRNRELAAFLVSIFSFGTVKQIQRTAKMLFEALPSNIWEYLAHAEIAKATKMLSIQHRFIKGADTRCILKTLQVIINEYGTIESLFKKHYLQSDAMKASIICFSEELRTIFRKYNGAFSERTLRFIFPSPASGCAAKRMNLFLRWMVRNDEIDLGLWDIIEKKQLIIPLDTHTARISRNLGLTTRKQPGWAMAQEITERLKQFDPEDPVKYDFAMTRLGMLSKGKSHIYEEYAGLS
jgi:uncharacterized protein (TIGR02757 family)